MNPGGFVQGQARVVKNKLRAGQTFNAGEQKASSIPITKSEPAAGLIRTQLMFPARLNQ